VTNHIGLDELAIQEGIRKPWETLLMMTKTAYGLYAFTHKDLERFAALVAAAEREACAKLCLEEANEAYHQEAFYLPRGNQGLLRIAEGAKRCAEAIRARGEQ
jgi:hypothetical protein